MGGAREHEAAFRANVQAARALREVTGDERQWMNTAYFYAAVQAVECWLADSNRHGINHADRLAILADEADPKVRSAYSRLKHASEDWRYHAKQAREGDATRAERCLETLASELFS